MENSACLVWVNAIRTKAGADTQRCFHEHDEPRRAADQTRILITWTGRTGEGWMLCNVMHDQHVMAHAMSGQMCRVGIPWLGHIPFIGSSAVAEEH